MDVFCIHVCFGLLCVPTIAIKQKQAPQLIIIVATQQDYGGD